MLKTLVEGQVDPGPELADLSSRRLRSKIGMLTHALDARLTRGLTASRSAAPFFLLSRPARWGSDTEFQVFRRIRTTAHCPTSEQRNSTTRNQRGRDYAPGAAGRGGEVPCRVRNDLQARARPEPS